MRETTVFASRANGKSSSICQRKQSHSINVSNNKIMTAMFQQVLFQSNNRCLLVLTSLMKISEKQAPYIFSIWT